MTETRPATQDECQEFLNNNAKLEAWRIVSIDGVRHRHRSVTLVIDPKNTINFTTLVPEDDPDETNKWVVQAAQRLFDARANFMQGT